MTQDRKIKDWNKRKKLGDPEELQRAQDVYAEKTVEDKRIKKKTKNQAR